MRKHAVVFAMVFVACAGGTGTIAPATTEPGADASAGDAGADATNDAPVDAARETGNLPCFATCRGAHPEGFNQARLGLYGCFCGAPCSSSCSSTEMCSGGPLPDDTCSSCAVGQLATCDQCSSSNQACKDFADCLRNSCP